MLSPVEFLYQIQKSGVLTCTKYGAIPALPTLEEVGFALGKWMEYDVDWSVNNF